MDAPYRIIDRRGMLPASGNTLFQSAITSDTRRNPGYLDRDTHLIWSQYGRQTMMSFGRGLFANFLEIRAAVLEIACFATATFQPQYRGKNPAWGRMAEDYLRERAETWDVRGWPYTRGTYLRNIVISALRDGGQFTLPCVVDGTAKIQSIPEHRVYGSDQSLGVIDGVKPSEYGAPLSYRVYGAYQNSPYTDISSSSLFPSYIPEYVDQLRGISPLGVGSIQCMHVSETREYEQIAQKVGAAIALIEVNDSGEADQAKAILAAQSTNAGVTGVVTEEIAGGLIRYIKAKSGHGLLPFKQDRPSQSQQSFEDRVLIGAFAALMWSHFMTLDPTKPGGASMRVVVEKCNRTLEYLRRFLVAPAALRCDRYLLAQAITAGWLPTDPDWYKWEYQGPPRLTADAKYDSDVDLAENRAGFVPMADICAKNGRYWEEVQDALIQEESRWQEQCKAAGLDPNQVRMKTPNGNIPTQQKDDSQNSTEKPQ